MNLFARQSRIIARAILIGLYFQSKYQMQARQSGITKAAKNLRKQGVSVEVAVQLLCY